MRSLAQSLDDRHRVEVAVGEENSARRQFLRYLYRRHAVHGECDGWRARRAGLDVPCVAVNLSPLNFQNAKLAAVVAETIAANGLPPETLMLEITEGVLVNERSAAMFAAPARAAILRRVM